MKAACVSLADKVRYEFSQWSRHGHESDGVLGVHISFSSQPLQLDDKPISVFLPLDQAARLLIGLKESFDRAIELAKTSEIMATRDVVERERAIARVLGQERIAGLFEGL